MAVLMFGGLTDSNILVKYYVQENPEFVPELLNNSFYTLLVQCSDMHETYQAETKAMTHKTEACPVIATICTRLSRHEINHLQQHLLHSMTTKTCQTETRLTDNALHWNVGLRQRSWVAVVQISECCQDHAGRPSPAALTTSHHVSLSSTAVVTVEWWDGHTSQPSPAAALTISYHNQRHTKCLQVGHCNTEKDEATEDLCTKPRNKTSTRV